MESRLESTTTAPARSHGTTTIVLEQTSAGSWRATQHGVDIEGYGPTAARAAAAYCQEVAADE
jgi:hypothetical protein